MAGIATLNKEVEKFINKQASVRGLSYYKKTLEEKIEVFRAAGLNLYIDRKDGEVVVVIEENGKVIRSRKFYLDTNFNGKTEVCKDDIVG